MLLLPQKINTLMMLLQQLLIIGVL
jgi:hypothetical protein